MIGIIDYGLGNRQALINVYNSMNIKSKIVKSEADLLGVTKFILPGVGSFDYAMQLFEQSGMRQPIEQLVLCDKIPVLGICVGMQMLAKSSEEGELPGLGWVEGTVKKFDLSAMTGDIRLPHMGWNDVKPLTEGGLFNKPKQDWTFYFLHSFFFECYDQANILAVSDYGGKFTSAVQNGNVFGVQFHPEKSHHFGSQLLINFSEI